jgi:hypothetical protein
VHAHHLGRKRTLSVNFGNHPIHMGDELEERPSSTHMFGYDFAPMLDVDTFVVYTDVGVRPGAKAVLSFHGELPAATAATAAKCHSSRAAD